MTPRRKFLLTAATAAGALVVGWSALPPRQRLETATPLPARAGETPLNGWLKISTDGSVVVMMSKSEMGQGVHTSLAMLAADELDADWARVTVAMSPIDDIYNNVASIVDGLPFHPDDHGLVKRFAGWMTAKAMREIGVMMTGGSSSLKDLWMPMREAGASARAMLVATAAQRWGVPPGEIQVSSGRLSHVSGQSAGFGELVADAAAQPLPRSVRLKSPAQFNLIGRSVSRIDCASKVDGSARFGADARPKGLLHASVVMCPVLGGTVASMDGTAASKLGGVKKIVQVPGLNGGTAGVAAIADSPWRAKQAAEAIAVTWNEGPMASVNSADLIERFSKTLDTAKGFAFHSNGDIDQALERAAKTVSAEYRAPYLAHATMEPANCTVQVKDGEATVWVSTQVPDIARSAVAKVLGIKADRVDVQVLLLGGGFGRRLDVDFIAQAAAIAQHADGVPVKTWWTREQDMTHDFYRPATVSRFKGGLDAQGRVVAWHNVSAGQALIPPVVERLFGLPAAGPDKTTCEGAFDQAYEWPASRIAHEAVDAGVPIGFWRSVGHSHHAFFKECFLDEMAAAAGKDPLEFRLALLERHPRHRAVLQRAAELAKWREPLAAAPDGAKQGRGIAMHESFGSIVAEVVEASVSKDKQIRVHRVICVIDCGFAVNPSGVRQQLEGAVAFGLSAALYGEIVIERGRVKQSNFHDQPALRMNEMPVVEVDIMVSAAHPEGVGEPGTPPLAPALANALFTVTGQRLRSLPLRLG